MKSKKTSAIILLIISGVLLAGFIVKTALDYASYSSSNGAPFELRVAVNALLFVLPAAVFAYIAMFILGRTRALGITSAVFGGLTAAALVYNVIRYGDILNGLIDGLVYALPFAAAAVTGVIFALIAKRRAKTAN